MADPTMAPSDKEAIFFACSGALMPNPTAQGTSVTERIFLVIAPISVVIFVRTPVTTGVSDGINIEVKSGLTAGDKLRGPRIINTEE